MILANPDQAGSSNSRAVQVCCREHPCTRRGMVALVTLAVLAFTELAAFTPAVVASIVNPLASYSFCQYTDNGSTISVL